MNKMRFLVLLFACLLACGNGSDNNERDTGIDTVGLGSDTGTDTADTATSDTGSDTGLPDPAEGITGTIRTNHFGWLPQDTKVAVLLGIENATVELRNAGNDTVVTIFVSGPLQSDEDSGDTYSTVDLTEHAREGTYYLFLPNTQETSYPFEIAEDVYDIVGRVAMKSFYFQRCNHSRVLPYAKDTLGDFVGINGNGWMESVTPATAPRRPDQSRRITAPSTFTADGTTPGITTSGSTITAMSWRHSHSSTSG